tara:strand:+ start:218 stop:808 length:591 start_codon:yes stop_codon:yes gene_type:complete
LLHRIYDEESDRHVHITFNEALNATCYGHADGPKGDLFGLATVSDELNPKLTANGGVNAATWRGLVLNNPLLPATQANNMKDLTTVLPNITAIITAVKDAIAAGQWVPVELVIARPFIEHLMLSAIVTVSGRDTGATLFGPAGKSLHHTLPLSLFPLSHIHTHLLRASTLSLCKALTCVCPLLPRLQTCKSPPTRA